MLRLPYKSLQLAPVLFMSAERDKRVQREEKGAGMDRHMNTALAQYS